MKRGVFAVVLVACSAPWLPSWLRDPPHGTLCSQYCGDGMECVGSVCEPLDEHAARRRPEADAGAEAGR